MNTTFITSKPQNHEPTHQVVTYPRFKVLQYIKRRIAECLLERAQYSKYFEHYNCIITQLKVPNIRENKHIGNFSFGFDLKILSQTYLSGYVFSVQDLPSKLYFCGHKTRFASQKLLADCCCSGAINRNSRSEKIVIGIFRYQSYLNIWLFVIIALVFFDHGYLNRRIFVSCIFKTIVSFYPEIQYFNC